jgi:hypothetical protein
MLHQQRLPKYTWSIERMDRQIVRDPIAGKAPLILRDLPERGRDWILTYAALGAVGLHPPRGS